MSATNMTMTSKNPKPDRTQYWLKAIFGLLLLGALKLAAPLIIPIALAVMIALILSPIVDAMHVHAKTPRVLAATATIVASFALVYLGLSSLSEPASQWRDQFKDVVPMLERKLSALREPMADIESLAETVDALTSTAQQDSSAVVEVLRPSAVQTIATAAPYFLASVGVTMFLSFFLLTYGPELIRRTALLCSTFSHRRRVLRTASKVRREITVLLGTISLINVLLGVASGFTLHWLGLPNAGLWGAMIAFANFAPYAGPALMTVVIAGVSIISLDTLAEALIPPAAFLALTILEGQVLTPLALGKQLNLNPLIVFVSVIFWGYLWGLAGALIAVPMLVSIKAILRSSPSTAALAALLSRAPLRA